METLLQAYMGEWSSPVTCTRWQTLTWPYQVSLPLPQLCLGDRGRLKEGESLPLLPRLLSPPSVPAATTTITTSGTTSTPSGLAQKAQDGSLLQKLLPSPRDPSAGRKGGQKKGLVLCLEGSFCGDSCYHCSSPSP
ncbi:unnamed protein product [Caretta caretta]